MDLVVLNLRVSEDIKIDQLISEIGDFDILLFVSRVFHQVNTTLLRGGLGLRIQVVALSICVDIASGRVVALNYHLYALRNLYLHAMNCKPQLELVKISFNLFNGAPGRVLLAHGVQTPNCSLAWFFAALGGGPHQVLMGALKLLRAPVGETAGRANCLTIKVQLPMACVATLVVVIHEVKRASWILLHRLVVLGIGHGSGLLLRAIV